MRKLKILSAILSILFIGFTYGVLFQRYRLFPYSFLKHSSIKIGISEHHPWAIGIYSGSSPFDLKDPSNIKNPVLTASDVTDIEAAFVADPFCVSYKGRYYMFFEVFNKKSLQGDIGYAVSKDFVHWTYRKVILDEPFHLSYPYVFSYNGEFYMVPECHRSLSVRLYRATRFPDEWKYVATLASGYHYSDPDIFFYNNRWWLLVSGPYKDAAYMFFSDNLLQGWTPCSSNPVIAFDPHRARNGGRIFRYKGRTFRVAQDCSKYYGQSTYAYEIVKVTPRQYIESLYSEKPLTKNSERGWNAVRMHHVDLIEINGKWYACVDGKGE